MPNLPTAQNSVNQTTAGGDTAAASLPVNASGLVARLGIFDATMIVMGGIIGSGIFINPYVVAQQVHTPALILGAWIAGGVIALGGAFIWRSEERRVGKEWRSRWWQYH